MSSTTDTLDGDVEGTTTIPKPRRTSPVPTQAKTGTAPGQRDTAGPDSNPSAEGDEPAEFVAFAMQQDRYAFPMTRVQEIIRMPALVRVPLGPAALEGLANLRGRVLPVVNLRICCGLPRAEPDDATRVVVVDASGVTLGFVVDRVAAVMSADAGNVESADTVQATIRSELLAAVIKGKDNEMTTVLDVQRLVDSEFAVLARQGTTSRANRQQTTGEGAVEEDSPGTIELVSFSVDGQEYALPIDRVREIVQAPERITPVPNADARVVGVMDLRGGLLPVISLRQIFGLPVTELEPQNRIIVVTISQDGREALVGVVLDTVREVLRVPAHLVGDLPDVVNGGAGHTEVRSVCRLEDGKRLVSVLSADALMDLHDLETVVRDAVGKPSGDDIAEETAMSTDQESGEDGRGDDELLVVFRLEDEEYCVDVDAVQEIIRVPDTLVRVPRTLDYVEGLVNLRGIVLPVVDLRTRLRLPRAPRDERQRIIVLIIDGIHTGFVVDSVAEVLKVSAADLEPAPELSADQARVVTQVANLAASTRMLLVLEPGQLLDTGQAARLMDEIETEPIEPKTAA